MSYVLGGPARRGRVAHVGVEPGRLPDRRARVDVVGGELVQRERERRQVGPADQPSGVELGQLRGGVAERLPLGDQLVGLVAEQPAERDREQHAEQRQVEEQVADLAQVPLLGRQPVAGVARGRPPEPEALPAEHRGGRVDGRVRRQRRRVRRRLRQPRQVPRRPRRRRPGRADQLERPRHDAPDQRGEEQDVDRREPGRGEHVEQPEAVQPRRERRVGREVLRHRRRVAALLRQDRAGHRAQREQEEQDERGPHGGELPPRPAPPAGPGRRRPRGPAAAALRRFGRSGSERTGGFAVQVRGLRPGRGLGGGRVHIGHWVTAASRSRVVMSG